MIDAAGIVIQQAVIVETPDAELVRSGGGGGGGGGGGRNVGGVQGV